MQIDDGTSSIAFPEYFASRLVPEVGDAKGNEKHAVFRICYQWLHAYSAWLSLVKWTVGATIGDEKEKCSAAPMFCCGAC